MIVSPRAGPARRATRDPCGCSRRRVRSSPRSRRRRIPRTSRRRSGPDRRPPRPSRRRSPRPAPGGPCESRRDGSCGNDPGHARRAGARRAQTRRTARVLGLRVAHHHDDARRPDARAPHADQVRPRLRPFPHQHRDGEHATRRRAGCVGLPGDQRPAHGRADAGRVAIEHLDCLHAQLSGAGDVVAADRALSTRSSRT